MSGLKFVAPMGAVLLLACGPQSEPDEPVDTTLDEPIEQPANLVDPTEMAMELEDIGAAQAESADQGETFDGAPDDTVASAEDDVEDADADTRSFEPERARPRASLASLISADDYPQSAIRAEEQGSVTVSLSIDEIGRVADCAVTGSSGSAALDDASCRIMMRRARFVPARDQTGQAIADRVSQTLRWSLGD